MAGDDSHISSDSRGERPLATSGKLRGLLVRAVVAIELECCCLRSYYGDAEDVSEESVQRKCASADHNYFPM